MSEDCCKCGVKETEIIDLIRTLTGFTVRNNLLEDNLSNTQNRCNSLLKEIRILRLKINNDFENEYTNALNQIDDLNKKCLSYKEIAEKIRIILVDVRLNYEHGYVPYTFISEAIEILNISEKHE